MRKLSLELKQRKPFRNLREEAMLNIWRTGDVLAEGLDLLLKSYDLSRGQYNVLRILRGAGEEGIPFGEVAERLLTRGPDVTRMVDRLARGGLAERVRVARDRRVILAKITPRALILLAELDGPVARLTDRMMGQLPNTRLKALIKCLEELRSGIKSTL